MMKKLLLVFFTLLILINSVNALDVKIYNNAFNIVNNKVVVETSITLNQNTTEEFQFTLPKDYEGLSIYVDGEQAQYILEENKLKLNLDDNSKIKFSYVTKEFIDKTNFLINIKLDFDTESLITQLILPDGATLRKPIQENDISSGSIYPIPTKATTDGKSLIFFWLKKDMKQGDDISIFTQIQPKTNSFSWVFILASFLIIAGLTIFFIPKKKQQIQEKIIIQKEDQIEKHLKPEEEQIINVLKLKESSCEQGTLRIATNFSKAHLSRLLKELEERNVIKKEKRGKKNLVFLRN